jgi:hypothetical protein
MFKIPGTWYLTAGGSMRLTALIAALLVAACSDDSGGITADTGGKTDTAVADSGAGLEAAPPVEQGTGNEAGPGDTGTADSGPTSCGPMDARGEGSCEMVLGTAWDGKTCVTLSGCSCQGNDCAKLFQSPADCTAAYKTCLCAPMDAKGDGPCKMLLGWIWDGKQCTSIGGCSCKGADCNRLYGTQKECQQAHATVTCP